MPSSRQSARPRGGQAQAQAHATSTGASGGDAIPSRGRRRARGAAARLERTTAASGSAAPAPPARAASPTGAAPPSAGRSRAASGATAESVSRVIRTASPMGAPIAFPARARRTARAASTASASKGTAASAIPSAARSGRATIAATRTGRVLGQGTCPAGSDSRGNGPFARCGDCLCCRTTADQIRCGESRFLPPCGACVNDLDGARLHTDVPGVFCTRGSPGATGGVGCGCESSCQAPCPVQGVAGRRPPSPRLAGGRVGGAVRPVPDRLPRSAATAD